MLALYGSAFLFAGPALAGAPRIAYMTETTTPLFVDIVDLAVDAQGNTWITGITRSDGLPITEDAFDPVRIDQEGYVIKLDPQGQVVYASYIGGDSPFDVPGSIAVDPQGNVYIAGATISTDFPVTLNAIQPTLNTSRSVRYRNPKPSRRQAQRRCVGSGLFLLYSAWSEADCGV
jgi:hypothetical protein